MTGGERRADERWDIARQVWSTAAEELNRLAGSISPEVFSNCVEILLRAGRVVTSGCGTSAMAARKIAHTLSCIERPSFFLVPSDAVHGALGSVQPGDAAILVSKGGGTAELCALLPALSEKQVPVIAVTEKPDSPLGRAAKLVVPIKVRREADAFNMLATTSTMAVIAWFDAVCIALMEESGYTRAQFAVIHPGGAVGSRLLDGGTPPASPGDPNG